MEREGHIFYIYDEPGDGGDGGPGGLPPVAAARRAENFGVPRPVTGSHPVVHSHPAGCSYKLHCSTFKE